MKMSIQKNNVLTFYTLCILIAFHILSIANMFKQIPVGAIISGLILTSIILNFKVLFRQLTVSNSLFIVFLLLIFLSLFNYLFNDTVLNYIRMHDDTLFKTFSYLIIPPMFFYIAGHHIERIKPPNINWVIDKIVLLNALSVVIGIALFLTVPDFYKRYVADTLINVYNTEEQFYPRMFSYYGNAMMLGVICSASIPLTFSLNRSVFFRIVLVVIFFIGAVMTLQRGSWFAASVGLVLSLLLKTNRSSIRKYGLRIIIVVSILAALIPILIILSFDKINNNAGIALTLQFFEERFLTVGSMVSERSYQWENVSKVLLDYPFGIGIGMLSHVTAANNFELAIPDGNYFRIIGELGPYGFIIFILLLIKGVIRGLMCGRPFYAVALIVYALQAVGTNVFDFYYTSFVFWLLIGILSATKKMYKPKSTTAKLPEQSVYTYGTRSIAKNKCVEGTLC